MHWLALSLLLLFFSGCGGSDAPPPLSQTSDVALAGDRQGVTPFVSFVEFRGASLGRVVAIGYTIEPKAGSASKAVDVQYPMTVLADRGYAGAGTGQVTLPVFGLYAGHANRVSMRLQFDDASTQQVAVTIDSAPYSDPNGLYDRPVFVQRRAAGSSLGFDFLVIKSGLGTPVVIDTDGEMRWVGSGIANSFSTAVVDNSFIVGEQRTLRMLRMELDGTFTQSVVDSPTLTGFHHSIDFGKQGLLAEFDAMVGGVRNVDSILAEISPLGAVLKQWDFAELIGNYMRSQGDDPSAFVRAGFDWFHMNAATYDPRDDSLIVSSRESFVIKIDYSSGDIKWILGDPTKYWFTFPSLRAKALRLEAGGLYPIGQHATSITSDGLLMLFNDGYQSTQQPAGVPVGDNRSYSAVSAYAIDAATMTAREAWRFDYGQSILSIICSSVYESPDKSLLVNYAVADNLTKARIVGLDAVRSVVFDLEYPTNGCSTSWNAEPIRFESMRF